MIKKIRKVYDDVDSDAYGFKFSGHGQTKQCFKDECDVNNILKRFEKTGVLPEMIAANPQYGDFSEVPDYQRSLEIVRMAQEQFGALSAGVRARFSNDPAEFLAFCHDEKNLEEMYEMGLAVRPKGADNEVKPVVPQVPPQAPQAPAGEAK